eukprot:CAMPEP_0198729978 /NCGR_PEP_ID=MMETSP1475-20131203/22109_1 /TAXON_ID= ORGANISM="Unidentified sp., Strain CCMP1999" /NCGR_SAMPLE_ID=MMETSP1475 /ASSEMBLY_ACC=CAM_ASM_001111 /LENGTH=1445 /DNA_ID=CAMNT_0044492713 /DNA_START=138 /DNA_END=4475 /DNA_ORIENTATION=-
MEGSKVRVSFVVDALSVLGKRWNGGGRRGTMVCVSSSSPTDSMQKVRKKTKGGELRQSSAKAGKPNNGRPARFGLPERDRSLIDSFDALILDGDCELFKRMDLGAFTEAIIGLLEMKQVPRAIIYLDTDHKQNKAAKSKRKLMSALGFPTHRSLLSALAPGSPRLIATNDENRASAFLEQDVALLEHDGVGWQMRRSFDEWRNGKKDRLSMDQMIIVEALMENVSDVSRFRAQQLARKHSSLDGLFAHADKNARKTPLYQRLVDSKEVVRSRVDAARSSAAMRGNAPRTDRRRPAPTRQKYILDKQLEELMTGNKMAAAEVEAKLEKLEQLLPATRIAEASSWNERNWRESASPEVLVVDGTWLLSKSNFAVTAKVSDGTKEAGKNLMEYLVLKKAVKIMKELCEYATNEKCSVVVAMADNSPADDFSASHELRCRFFRVLQEMGVGVYREGSSGLRALRTVHKSALSNNMKVSIVPHRPLYEQLLTKGDTRLMKPVANKFSQLKPVFDQTFHRDKSTDCRLIVLHKACKADGLSVREIDDELRWYRDEGHRVSPTNLTEGRRRRLEAMKGFVLLAYDVASVEPEELQKRSFDVESATQNMSSLTKKYRAGKLGSAEFWNENVNDWVNRPIKEAKQSSASGRAKRQETEDLSTGAGEDVEAQVVPEAASHGGVARLDGNSAIRDVDVRSSKGRLENDSRGGLSSTGQDLSVQSDELHRETRKLEEELPRPEASTAAEHPAPCTVESEGGEGNGKDCGGLADGAADVQTPAAQAVAESSSQQLDETHLTENCEAERALPDEALGAETPAAPIVPDSSRQTVRDGLQESDRPEMSVGDGSRLLVDIEGPSMSDEDAELTDVELDEEEEDDLDGRDRVDYGETEAPSRAASAYPSGLKFEGCVGLSVNSHGVAFSDGKEAAGFLYFNEDEMIIREILMNSSWSQLSWTLKEDCVEIFRRWDQMIGAPIDLTTAAKLLNPRWKRNYGTSSEVLNAKQSNMTRAIDNSCKAAQDATNHLSSMVQLLTDCGLDEIMDQYESQMTLTVAELECRGISTSLRAVNRLRSVCGDELRRIQSSIEQRLHDERTSRQLRNILEVMAQGAMPEVAPKSHQESEVESYLEGEEYRSFSALCRLRAFAETKVDVKRQRYTPTVEMNCDDYGALCMEVPVATLRELVTEAADAFQASIEAEPNHNLIHVSYRDLELRLLASHCGDPRLLKAFDVGLDCCRAVAAFVFNLPEDQVVDTQQALARVLLDMATDGLSANSTMKSLLAMDESEGICRENLRSLLSCVAKARDSTTAKLRKRGFVEALSGRKIFVNLPKEYDQSGRRNKHLGLTFVPEEGGRRGLDEVKTFASNLMRHAAREDFMKLAIARAIECGSPTRDVRLIFKDENELVFQVPKSQTELMKQRLSREMHGVLCLPRYVNLDVELGVGENWLAARRSATLCE